MIRLTQRRYRSDTPIVRPHDEYRICSLVNIKAHKPRSAVFFRAHLVACLLWAAVSGAFGLLVSFGVPVCKPGICRPPRFAAGRGVTTHQGGHYG